MRRRAEPFDSRAAKCARSRCTPSDAHVCATAAVLPDTWRGQFSTSLQAVVVLGFRDGLKSAS